jgi:hypothetical protein
MTTIIFLIVNSVFKVTTYLYCTSSALSGAVIGKALGNQRNMVGLDKALAIATYPGFSIFLILAFSYLFYPSYIDHVESTIATLGSIFLSGGQIYPELTVYSLHGLIYGPGLAEIQAVFQSLGLPVVMASKIPSVLAFAFSSIVLLLFLKNNLARSYLLFLLPFGLFMFWNRAEPFLVLLVALSLIAMAYANGLFAVFLIGIFAGFASSLKLHAALYVVAALIAGGSFTSFGVVGVILFSAGAAYSGPIRQDRNPSSLSWRARPSRSCLALPHSC